MVKRCRKGATVEELCIFVASKAIKKHTQAMKQIVLTVALATCVFTSIKAQSNYGTSGWRNTGCSSLDTSNMLSGCTTNSSVRYQQGYTRSNGTYVQGHYKTQTNSTNHDNFSTVGNINTYTGTTGIRARDYSAGALNYGSGRVIETGSRGGQYYINQNGNRTYVPKRW